MVAASCYLNGKYCHFQLRGEGSEPELMVEGGETEVDTGRRLRAKEVTIPSVRLGLSEIDHKVWLVKGPPENVLSGIDGFLGTSSMKSRWIKFNFATNTLNWR
jgi:hypothetical protein